jgi:acyl-CoA synthetase (AMP-forming)/AMP-acid ligase II
VSAEGLLASDFATLPEVIRAHAIERPDQTALVEGDKTLTYGALAARMDRIAFALQRDGVQKGDVAAICARTSLNYGAAFCGVLAAGAAVAPLPPSATPSTLLMMLKDGGRTREHKARCARRRFGRRAFLWLGGSGGRDARPG